MYSCLYSSPLGLITLLSDGSFLTGLYFGDRGETDKSLKVFDETKEYLDLYFQGTVPDFCPPLNPTGSAFQKSVWSFLLSIPYGETRSYKKIAAMTGKPNMSAQAIGGAVSRNPISIIIPCHRVIGSDGSLTGYAGGIEKKKWLLEHEKRSL